MKKLRLGVLVSGRGSNLQAIIDSVENGSLSAEIVVVISDQADAYAIERARKHNIEALAVGWRSRPSREAYDAVLAAELKKRKVDLICLAGFMRVITETLIREFPNRIMNIHPALLPSFPGIHVQKKALEYGAKFSGCTVHFVDEGVDTGPIIIQAVVPVLDDDTEETLAQRILMQEHLIFPKAIQLYAEGRLTIEGRRVLCRGTAGSNEAFLINP